MQKLGVLIGVLAFPAALFSLALLPLMLFVGMLVIMLGNKRDRQARETLKEQEVEVLRRYVVNTDQRMRDEMIGTLNARHGKLRADPDPAFDPDQYLKPDRPVNYPVPFQEPEPRPGRLKPITPRFAKLIPTDRIKPGDLPSDEDWTASMYDPIVKPPRK